MGRVRIERWSFLLFSFFLSRMPFYELYELMICVDNIEVASFCDHLLLLHDIEG